MRNMVQETNQKAVELILSILLAVSMSYALILFLEFDDLTWLFLSIVIIAIAIFLIYSLLDIKLNKLSDFLMLISFSLGMLLPFSLGKVHKLNSLEDKFSGSWWDMDYLLIHLGILGISLILWGISLQFKDKNKEKAKRIYWAGSLLIGLVLLSFVIKYGGTLR